MGQIGADPAGSGERQLHRKFGDDAEDVKLFSVALDGDFKNYLDGRPFQEVETLDQGNGPEAMRVLMSRHEPRTAQSKTPSASKESTTLWAALDESRRTAGGTTRTKMPTMRRRWKITSNTGGKPQNHHDMTGGATHDDNGDDATPTTRCFL